MGGSPLPHSKIITRVARAILRPMGLVQKGQSRVWLDDHGWRVYMVEFQPSGWSRGSYLNIACSWLWPVKDHLSFDLSLSRDSRVGDFEEFHDEAQFEAVATKLVNHAAKDVAHYRTKFTNVGTAADCAVRNPRVGWGQFHAGILCALAGRTKEARRWLNKVCAVKNDPRDWFLALQADAAALDALAADISKFRDVIESRIHETRGFVKLPAVPSIDFDS